MQNRGKLQGELNTVLCELMDRNPEIGYAQGLNDIVGILMLILGKDHSLIASERVCLYYIKDMLLESFEQGLMPILRLILKILKEIDPGLHELLSAAVQETPGFAISWVLTWLSHELNDLDLIARIFDYLICSHPIAPAYLSVAVFF